MTDQSIKKNMGFVSLDMIPDDQEICAVVVVTKDDAGEFASVMIPVDQEQMPSAETQDLLCGHTATAVELASMGIGS